VKRYIAIVCKDPDSAFGVHFPDLPGCTAAGDTQEEALDNAGIALRSWSEDLSDLPPPSDMQHLLLDRDVRTDLAAGGVAILVPLLTGGKKQRLNIMIEPGLVEATDMAAKTSGISRSAYIERALESEIARELGAVRKVERKKSKTKSPA
jgi:predicted RNase H-like HicB family nuclease